MALMAERVILTRTTTANGGDALALVPEVNTQLHETFPALNGNIKVRMAGARNDLGYPWWHFSFELLENGKRIGSDWELTYEKPDKLGPLEQAVLENLHRLN